MKNTFLKSNLLDLVILAFAVSATILVIVYLIGERTTDYSIASDKLTAFLQTQNPILIDLRESNEIPEMRLSYHQVMHQPFLDLQKDISKLSIDTTRTYLLVCNDGNRSRLISASLSSQGFTIPYLRDGLWGVPEDQLSRLRRESD